MVNDAVRNEAIVKDIVTTLVDEVVANERIVIKRSQDCMNIDFITVKKIKSIQVQPALKRKGRPKRSEKTNVIGLSKGKQKTKTAIRKFSDMRLPEKKDSF